MTDEIIKRFFKKQCTDEEAMQVAEYLKSRPVLLNKYLREEEWDNIEISEMPEEFWSDVWGGIQKSNKKSTIVLWIKRTAAAACFAGIIGMAYYQFEILKQNNIPDRNESTGNVQIPVNAEHKIVGNDSKKIKHIVLPDSSIVELSANSVIRFDIPFQNNKREIHLEGEAYFKVVPDKTKPFTVYANSLATTALGTEFRITTTNANQNNITVKLFTGKVIIRSVSDKLKGWSKDVYLQPGEQMKYDADKMLLAIEKTKNSDSAEKIQNHIINKKHVTVANDELTFNGSPLHDVMERLSKYFNVKIEYEKKEIENMNFTGTITKKDSVITMLKVIAQMNDLEISQQDGGFVVKKIKQ